MCYVLYLSTDSPVNLTARNSGLVTFERLEGMPEDRVMDRLEFPHRWFVGSAGGGCSCGFRHLCSTDLGFGEPVDWFPEEPDEIDATKELYGVICWLLESGHRVDLVDRWEGVEPGDIHNLRVPLADVTAESFRLFENYRFTFE